MTDAQARRQLQRLMTWLEQFKVCFGRKAQVLALRRYVQGLLSDSARKSMEAMLARVTDPGSYQAFQYFISEAKWDADRVWRRLREVLPVREGVVIIDGTSFPKQGEASVGVARQYCGALGKIANCQVAVTAALWHQARAYLVGATLYLPEAWLTPLARDRAKVPPTTTFQEKWRQAVALLHDIRDAGLRITGVLADAEFGDTTAFRQVLHAWGVPYAVGVSSHLTVFRGSPPVTVPPSPTVGRPRTRGRLPAHITPEAVSKIAGAQRRWTPVTWRNSPGAPQWTVRAMALRVTPAHDWQRGLAPEVWLLCERDTGRTPRTKYYFVSLPATTSLKRLVQFAHQRWAIEQQYQELKTELGFDHFEGRSLPGWQHHAVLTALTYNFLQVERARRHVTLTFPQLRAIVQEIFTAYLFAQQPRYLRRIEALKGVELRI